METRQSMFRKVLAVTLPGLLAGFLGIAPVYAAQTICATVQLQISQNAALEREGFVAKLALTNNLSDTPIADLSAYLVITDSNGNPADNLFYSRVTDLQNATAVDGTGTIQPSQKATIQWLIIPSTGAGGNAQAGLGYNIRARMAYNTAGIARVLNTTDASVTVMPQPLVKLEYVLPLEIFGDEPLTPVVESTEPFYLGVRATNIGYGQAANFSIASAQPQIVVSSENLAVAFSITDAWLPTGTLADKTLQIDFGNISPSSSALASWSMTSSFSGRFTDFTASYIHNSTLGGALTSLIDSVTTYTLIKDVLDDTSGRDSQFDFLINTSIPRANAWALVSAGQELTPEYIMESDRTAMTPVQNVSATLNGTLSGSNSTLHLVYNAAVSTGTWVHASVPFSSGGLAAISSVLRANSTTVNARNIWISKHFDKTTLTYSYHLHILDYVKESSPNYAITFKAGALDTAPAPVTDLAADVTANTNGITWTSSGEDGSSGTIYNGKIAVFASTDTAATPSLGAASVVMSTTALSGTTQYYLLNSLLGDATYQMALWTADARGNYSSASNDIVFFTYARPPADVVSSSITASGFALSWSDRANMPGAQYRLKVSTAAGATMQETEFIRDISSWTFTGLSPDADYAVAIQPRDDWLRVSSYSVVANVTTLADAPLPATTTFMSISSASISAAWSANGNPARTVYMVQASTSADFGIIASSAMVSASSGGVSSLLPDRTYVLRVAAVNASGTYTGYTVLDSTVTFAAIPGAPEFSNVFSTAIYVAWGTSGNPSDTRYHVELSTAYNFEPVYKSSDVASTSYTFRSLNPSTTYFARINAINRNGISTDFSTLISTVTGSPYMVIDEISPASGPVGTLVTLHGRNFGVYQATATFVLIGGTTAQTMLWNDNNIQATVPGSLNPGAYSILVEHLSEDGVDISNTSRAFTVLAVTGLSPKVDQVYASTMTVSWMEVSSATYTVVLSTASDFSTIVSSSSLALAQVVFPGLSDNTTYYFEVKLSTEADLSYVSNQLVQFMPIFDAFPPRTAVAYTNAAATNGMVYISSSSYVVFTSTDDRYAAGDGLGLGVKNQYRRLDSGDWVVIPDTLPAVGKVLVSSAPLSGLADGIHILQYYAADALSSIEAIHCSTFVVDSAPPVITISMAVTGAVFVSTSSNFNLNVSFNYSDGVDTAPYVSAALVEMRNMGYSAGMSSMTVTNGQSVDTFLLDDGYWQLQVTAVDASGNTVTAVSGIFEITHRLPVSWSGKGGDYNWFTATNWSGNSVPVASDDVTIDSNVVVAATTAPISFNSLTLGGTNSPTLRLSTGTLSSGILTVKKNATFEQSTISTVTFYSVMVETGGKLTHTANTTTKAYQLNIQTVSDFTLQPGATVYMDARGYSGGASGAANAGYGPGAGYGGGQGSGGGHGGRGGNSSTTGGGANYDNILSPSEPGSGGGSCATVQGVSGGGLLVASVGGTANLNGLITCNGADGYADYNQNGGGAGAGGGVGITAANITGTGSIFANGGSRSTSASGGGGGGGIIALTALSSSSFSGSMSAMAGAGIQNGGAGIIAVRNGSAGYDLTIDGKTLAAGAYTALSANLMNISSVTISTANVSVSTIAVQNLVLGRNALLVTNSITADNNVALQYNSVLKHSGNGSVKANWLALNVAGDLSVDSGASIQLAGLGYAGGGSAANGSGPGAGPGGVQGGGAGHGGRGGKSSTVGSGAVYDSVINPVELGSGGGGGTTAPGGAGGGMILAQIGHNLRLDGTIDAGGNNGSGDYNSHGGGGGSGGTINVSAASISGAGVVKAEGGSYTTGGGGSGAGGIIRLDIPGATGFAGTISAKGGRGSSHNACPGTIVLRNAQSLFDLIVDGKDMPQALNSSLALGGIEFGNVSISTGVIITTIFNASNITLGTGGVLVVSSLTVHENMTMRNTSLLKHGGNTTVKSNWLDLRVDGDLTVDSGASIQLAGLGYAGGAAGASGSGPGAAPGGEQGGGAGHGGRGGKSSTVGSGGVYDSVINPAELGSGGGGGTAAPGGAGGGMILARIGGNLAIAGSIIANGNDGSGDGNGHGGGGGSGGTIDISAGSIGGAGVIQAEGGSYTHGYGGGGAGGMIRLDIPGATDFAGSISARGGIGRLHNACAGTAVLKNEANGLNLVIDGKDRIQALNATLVLYEVAFGTVTISTATVITSTITAANVELKTSGVLVVSSLTVHGNMTMRNNSILTHSGNGAVKANWLELGVDGNLTLDAGASIDLSGVGYAAGASGTSAGGNGYGPGAGLGGVVGSGGGHGGRGGNGSGSGGSAYDIASAPFDLGSGGGGGINHAGGAGGGLFVARVNGTARLNGAIRANGNGAVSDYDYHGAGGGAGGSIDISAGGVIGNGTITANGGSVTGGRVVGGGGAGGLIAVRGFSCPLSVSLSATGGTGSQSGGAGQISDAGLYPPVLQTLVSTGSFVWSWNAINASSYRILNSTNGYVSDVLSGTVTSFSEGGLSQNTSYIRKISAYSCISSTTSLNVSRSTLAGPVTVAANPFVAVSSVAIAATWTALPATPSSATAEGYVLELSTTNFGVAAAGGVLYSSATPNVALNSLRVDGLDPLTTYYARVGSLNWDGVANYTALASTQTHRPIIHAISSVTPSSAPVGEIMTIAGTDFGEWGSTTTAVVLLASTTLQVSSWTDTEIAAVLPFAATGQYTLTVERLNEDASVAWTAISSFTLTVPAISGLSPAYGDPGSAFILTGTSFGSYNSAQLNGNTMTRVMMDGTAACALSSWNNTEVRGVIPDDAATGNRTLTVVREVSGGTQTSNGVTFDVGGSGQQGLMSSNAVSASKRTNVASDPNAGLMLKAAWGGHVESASRAAVDMPANALAQNTFVTVATATVSEDLVARMLDSEGKGHVMPVGSLLVFGPEKLELADSVRITLPYDATKLPAGKGVADLAIFKWDDAAGKWVELETSLVGGRLVAYTKSMSLYQSMVRGMTSSASAEFTFRQFYVYPNPAKGGKRPILHLECGVGDSVDIRIYDVAGELRHNARLEGLPQVSTPEYAYEYMWDMSGAGSGVYSAIVVAHKSGYGDIKARKKFAIIR